MHKVNLLHLHLYILREEKNTRRYIWLKDGQQFLSDGGHVCYTYVNLNDINYFKMNIELDKQQNAMFKSVI